MAKLRHPFVILERDNIADITAAITKDGNVWTLQTEDDMENFYESFHAEQASKYAVRVKSKKGLNYSPSERNRTDVSSG